MSRTNAKFERGFTLVEAVIVILITGIVAGMVALFIRLPVQGYIDSEARAELTDAADTAFLRMSRDLRLALPNSVRTATTGGNQYLELLLTKTAGRHLATEDNPTSGSILSFTNPLLVSFDVLNPMPTGAQAIVPGDFIVVFNTGPLTNADAYTCNGTPPCNRAKVATVLNNTITLESNLFVGLPAPASNSPGRGFQVVTSAVTYECNPSARTLTRYWGYAIQSIQPSAPLASGSSALLATGITACSFSYNTASAGLNIGLVGLSLTMRAATNSEQVTLLHQVYVDNTP